MTPFWFLAAACCIPSPDRKSRIRERKILAQAFVDSGASAKPNIHGRWDSKKPQGESQEQGEIGSIAMKGEQV
jgi:hypothetical protein